jgi:hypothetical protein
MKESDSHPSPYAAFGGTERGLRARFGWAALSVGIHLILLFFVQLYNGPSARSGGLPEVRHPLRFFTLDAPPEATRELQFSRASVEPAPPEPELVVPQRVATAPMLPGPRVSTPRRATAGAGSTGAPGEGAAAESAGPSLERLRYRSMPTGEVWRRSEPPPPPVESAEAMVRARVAAQLNAYNDSIAAEAAASARATDWTVTDADGGRWGVSPGKIHLGSLTLPLPFTFSAPPERREEVAGRLANWTAIQQQATIVEGREIVKDRNKAIEQRKAAERAARRNPSTTTPPGAATGGTGSTGGATPPRGGS